MAMSKNHRFGLITFVILIISTVLVTTEPWKNNASSMETSVGEASPPVIRLRWDLPGDGYPEISPANSVRSLRGFDLVYNEGFEQASWVAYVLTREMVERGTVDRTDDFRADRGISTGSAALADYRRSGYDRGHLAPAADMKWDTLAMSESFLLSNMSPQTPAFNRGIWKRLEEQVRDWAVEKESIYVVTGPVLSTVHSTIGENGVGVPGYYFKVLADLSPPDHSFIAFLLPNEGSSEELLHYAITVDSLEQFTGRDFFASAPDQEMIDWLEARIDLSRWN